MKGTRAPWRSGGFQSWSKGKYKISLEHHVLPENRELLKKKKKKKGWGLIKDIGALSGQSWNDRSNKIMIVLDYKP